MRRTKKIVVGVIAGISLIGLASKKPSDGGRLREFPEEVKACREVFNNWSSACTLLEGKQANKFVTSYVNSGIATLVDEDNSVAVYALDNGDQTGWYMIFKR